MKKIRGFLVKRKVFSLFRYIRRKSHSSTTTYRRLNPSRRTFSRFIKWGSKLKSKARAICSKNPSFRSGYLRVRDDPLVEVPKGKMAVYVGQEDGDDYERVLVPVIYINHPLFGQLLRKAEDEYGHDHPGGITIPCRVSEFENVKTRIAAVCGGRKMMLWKRGV
ncbi:Auxin responsive SAUR protein [Artemisia annua]|uniref:Auxin responsive SAUR protein n=1 Tax=Artemisia annua TaxID=35608 RepID=A0A2U1M644_ARTAN|nr:Auxin responsive SAUR protein [Artemisia annua]